MKGRYDMLSVILSAAVISRYSLRHSDVYRCDLPSHTALHMGVLVDWTALKEIPLLADNSYKVLLFQLQSLKNLLSIKEGVTELRGAAKWSHVGETTCFARKFVRKLRPYRCTAGMAGVVWRCLETMLRHNVLQVSSQQMLTRFCDCIRLPVRVTPNLRTRALVTLHVLSLNTMLLIFQTNINETITQLRKPNWQMQIHPQHKISVNKSQVSKLLKISGKLS